MFNDLQTFLMCLRVCKLCAYREESECKIALKLVYVVTIVHNYKHCQVCVLRETRKGYVHFLSQKTSG